MSEETKMDYRFASFRLTDPSQNPDAPDSPPVLLVEALTNAKVGFESFLAEFTAEEAKKEEDFADLYADGAGPEQVRLLEFFTTKDEWKDADAIVANLLKKMGEGE